jgi:subtilisin family serine protease
MLKSSTACLALALFPFLLAMPVSAPAQTPAPRTVVHDETQLPRFSYPVTMAASALLVADDATFAPFAKAVGADVDATLRTYQIEDKGALRDFISTKLALQVLAHDDAGARESIAALRAAETKPDLQVLAARLNLAYLDALAQTKAHPGTTFDAAFAAVDRSQTDALPWEIVADTIRASYAQERTATKAGAVGSAVFNLDPVVAKTGALDGPSARALVRARAQLEFALPLFESDARIIAAYIARHDAAQPDIWAARNVTLSTAQVKAPVQIGIWDSGVDPSDYQGSMYVDASGKNGLAFSDDGSPASSDLDDLPADVRANYARDVALLIGREDLQSGIDSPAADAAVQFLRSLSAAQQAALSRDFDFVGHYAHGSHVAGIASRGNPGARLVVARFDDDLPDLKFVPTTEWAQKMAANFAQIAAYFRANHVRVVNASWGDNVAEFEEWLAKTDTTSDPQARKQRAQALYAIWRGAVANVIEQNPGTLFVVSAGNGDDSTSFNGSVPPSLDYPNMLVVGAVNQAGQATNFTSYGPNVKIYSDGYLVPSKIPGGYTARFSGTSMAAPNVTNLAAKLFALDPSLTPLQVKALILDGATPLPGSTLPLMNPKRSVELLGKPQT